MSLRLSPEGHRRRTTPPTVTTAGESRTPASHGLRWQGICAHVSEISKETRSMMLTAAFRCLRQFVTLRFSRRTALLKDRSLRRTRGRRRHHRTRAWDSRMTAMNLFVGTGTVIVVPCVDFERRVAPTPRFKRRGRGEATGRALIECESSIDVAETTLLPSNTSMRVQSTRETSRSTPHGREGSSRYRGRPLAMVKRP
jgi:hypothetical protein